MCPRSCGCCGGELSATASKQMLYLPGHRQRRYQRKRDARVRKALRAVEGQGGVKTTASASSSGRRRQARRASPTRYALVRREGAVLEIVGFSFGKSKRWVERAFGISDHADIGAVAEQHLPGVG